VNTEQHCVRAVICKSVNTVLLLDAPSSRNPSK